MRNQVVIPDVVYHGTLDVYLHAFKENLLDPSKWRPNRDFGEGLYTTISFEQAKKWARLNAAEYLGAQDPQPCVLEIGLLPVTMNGMVEIFMGPTLRWAEFILEHRMNKIKGFDPCQAHPDIIAGPMADNRTSALVEDVLQLNQDAAWFLRQITRSKKGRILDSQRLGNQVVFCNENLRPMLRLTGYYIYTGSRWRYYENSGIQQA